MPLVLSVSSLSMKLKNTDIRLMYLPRLILTLGVIAAPVANLHAGFDVSASPPRFEMKAKPGEIIRQTLQISNHENQSARYQVKAADWELGASGEAIFQEAAPASGSCRPWVRVERHEISVAPKDTRNFRFEIHVPKDAASGECRIALLVSSDAGLVTPRGGNFIQIPIVGRLGIIVYVTIGDAKPAMKLERIVMKRIDGKLTPVATVHNSGTAHSRVQGSLKAVDAASRKLSLVPNEVVILPNARREVSLNPVDWSEGEGKPPAYSLALPLRIKGTLQFQDGGEVEIDQVLQ